MSLLTQFMLLQSSPPRPITPEPSFRGHDQTKVTQVSKGLCPQKETVTLAPCHSYGKELGSSLEGMLKSKIMSFREYLNMAPSNVSTTLHELLVGTLEDLHSKYDKCISCAGISKLNHESSHQVLLQFYKVLKSVGDLWAENCSQTEKFRVEKEVDQESLSSQQLGERILDRLNHMNYRTREMFDLTQKSSVTTSVSKSHKENPSVSPLTPTSVLPETSQCNSNSKDYSNLASVPPLLRPIRLHTVANTKPVNGMQFAFVPLLVHQNDETDSDHNLDFLEAFMSMEPDGNNANSEGRPSETTILMSSPSTPHMLHLKSLLKSPTSSPTSSPRALSDVVMASSPLSVSENDTNVNRRNISMLRLRAPALQSATPTPPPSPMVIQGFFMSMEPISYAMTIDETDTDTVCDTSNVKDQDKKSKSSEPQKPPPDPPLPPSRFAPPTPPPKGSASVAPPPPPPLGAPMSPHAKKNTKLRRSSEMGKLYRSLKGKVEGSTLNGKSSEQSKCQVGGGSGNDKGQGSLADALAEITKRSAYFQQIEEDVEKYASMILELKSAIGSFHAKEMTELVKFHKHVELQLEKLSDETQVLCRFENFPYKKLETIRMAVALNSKLDGIVTTLRSWKVMSPIAQQLDKIESYFNKIKEEMDMIDRNKEEETKRFQSHKIELDFSVLVRIKESMVDLSSNCIEIALKESKESKEAVRKDKKKSNSISKILWRAFQLAFRVYNFAGGQDDRADRLTSELAHEIETYPRYEYMIQ